MLHLFSDARWIAADPICASPVLLRRFSVENVRKATLHITGLGFFEARINDHAVTEDWFQPLISDYEPRDLAHFLYPLHDKTTHRIYYCTYDITPLLQSGENLLSIQLGNGWYRQTERLAEGKVDFGTELKALYCLTLETDEGVFRFLSDGSETWRKSEIVYSNLFIGELHDPSALDVQEYPVHTVPAPASQLTPQAGAPDRLIRTLQPKWLGTKDGRSIYDAGENISGLVRISTSAPEGQIITLRFAENILPDLSLDFYSTGANCLTADEKPQLMHDRFVATGKTRSFTPKFVWHSFRYFDVEGSIDSAEVLVIHSDVSCTARFSSSSEGLNFLFDAYIRTQLDNMHGSIPSDCPHRERLGYTGDGQICAPAGMMLLNSETFYRKWIQDILDCQDILSGHVQHTAPLMGGGGGPGGWGCAIVLVPYAFYLRFGDAELLQRCYQPMRRWVDYLQARSENGLVVREEEGGWCLGDWCTLQPTILPEPFVNTCYFLKILQILCQIAPILGHAGDVPEYEALIQTVSAALKTAYQPEINGPFCGGIQGADAYAVWAGLSGAEAVQRLVDFYDDLGHFDTGFLCTDILLEVLFIHGHADTALRLLESEDPGSFLYMKRHGASTIWETWRGEASHNHPMFGACARQLFEGILGIRQLPGSTAYQNLCIEPQIPQNLSFASGSLQTPQGEIAVAWHKRDSEIDFEITLPAGVSASFRLGDQVLSLKIGKQTFSIA